MRVNCGRVESSKKEIEERKGCKHWEVHCSVDSFAEVFPSWEALPPNLKVAFLGHDNNWKVKVLAEFTHERSRGNVGGWSGPAIDVKPMKEEDFIKFVKQWKSIKVIVAEKEAFKRTTERWQMVSNLI